MYFAYMEVFMNISTTPVLIDHSNEAGILSSELNFLVVGWEPLSTSTSCRKHRPPARPSSA